MPYANNKGADQPMHPRSLISTFVVRCLSSLVHLVSISEIPSVYLAASVAAQAGLFLTWSQTPKTDFFVTRLKLFRVCLVHSRIWAASDSQAHIQLLVQAESSERGTPGGGHMGFRG